MSDEKKWADLTPEERRDRMNAGRQREAAKRQEQADKDVRLLSQLRSGDLIGDEPESPPPESGELESGAPAIVEPEMDERAEKRARLLASIPEELRDRFPTARLDQIIADAEQKALEEKEKAILRDLRGLASSHARADLDLIPQSELVDAEAAAIANEKVWVTINCPGGGAGDGTIGYRISGLLYQHGQRYLVARHIANQLGKMHYDAHYHEVLFRTLDQHKAGNSAADIMAQHGPFMKVEDPFDKVGVLQ